MALRYSGQCIFKYFSFKFIIDKNRTLVNLTQIGTIAVNTEINNYLPRDRRASTKWPNDIYINNKKNMWNNHRIWKI